LSAVDLGVKRRRGLSQEEASYDLIGKESHKMAV
jgi:hypothetical protein